MVLTTGNHQPATSSGMPPVAKIATGFVFAFGAFRLNGFDLLFDPVGWGLCASGLSLLQRSGDDAFGRARSFAVTMMCVSFVVLVIPGVDVSDSPIGRVIGIASTGGSLITVWLAVDAVIRRIRPYAEVSRRIRPYAEVSRRIRPYAEVSRVALLDVLRWTVLVLGLLGLLVGYGYADPTSAVLMAWFASVVALVVVLYGLAGLPYLSQAGGD
jgi:hypothetical protein